LGLSTKISCNFGLSTNFGAKHKNFYAMLFIVKLICLTAFNFGDKYLHNGAEN